LKIHQSLLVRLIAKIRFMSEEAGIIFSRNKTSFGNITIKGIDYSECKKCGLIERLKKQE